MTVASKWAEKAHVITDAICGPAVFRLYMSVAQGERPLGLDTDWQVCMSGLRQVDNP
jgi:hypothetical protein